MFSLIRRAADTSRSTPVAGSAAGRVLGSLKRILFSTPPYDGDGGGDGGGDGDDSGDGDKSSLLVDLSPPSGSRRFGSVDRSTVSGCCAVKPVLFSTSRVVGCSSRFGYGGFTLASAIHQGSSSDCSQQAILLKGTTNVSVQADHVVTFGVDGLGADWKGNLFDFDLVKLFSFQNVHKLKNVMMMYAGCAYTPYFLREKLWRTPGDLVDAVSCASFAKTYVDKQRALLIKEFGNPLPENVIYPFDFKVVFASVGESEPSVSILDGLTGELFHNVGNFVQGNGKKLGIEYYKRFYDDSFVPGIWFSDEAYLNYKREYNLYTVMDIMIQCSGIADEPSGGIIRIMEATSTGTELLWEGDLEILIEERERHWREEMQRFEEGVVSKPSPIEWNFAHEEASRYKRGLINKMRFRSYRRCDGFVTRRSYQRYDDRPVVDVEGEMGYSEGIGQDDSG